MAKVLVTLNWVKSVTAGVTHQKLLVTLNDVAQPVTELAADVQTHSFEVEEKTKVAVELWATDGALESAHVSASGDAPQLTPPAAPTNLVLTFTPVPTV
jgi:hypothetical protein